MRIRILASKIKAQTLEKSAQIGSYSIHFGFSSANWCGSGSTTLHLYCTTFTSVANSKLFEGGPGPKSYFWVWIYAQNYHNKQPRFHIPVPVQYSKYCTDTLLALVTNERTLKVSWVLICKHYEKSKDLICLFTGCVMLAYLISSI